MSELKRLQHILELLRAAMRDDLLPASVLAPIVNHCVDLLMALREDL